jgi:competence protein CoiA
MWLDSSVPVIFVFRGVDESQPPDVFRDTLWCLLPGRAEGSAVVVGMSREQFVKVAPSRPQLLEVQELLTGFARYIRELRAANTPARPFSGMPGGRRSRRRYARF